MQHTLNKTARLAGALYLICVITGILHLVYIPSLLIDSQDITQTVQHLRHSEVLYRWEIVSGIICYLDFIALVLVLYKLLHQVNKSYAQVMVILVLVTFPINFVNLLNEFSILSLIKSSSGLPDADIVGQVKLYLNAYYNGINLSQILWGLWLFPFGVLVYRSGFLPRLLGAFLMAGCFGYLIEFFGSFLFPAYRGSTLSSIVSIPASIGELGTCLWLLIAGARTIHFRKAASQTL